MAPSAIVEPTVDGSEDSTKKHATNPIDPDILPLLDADFVDYYNRSVSNTILTHQVPLIEVRKNPQSWASSWVRDYSGHEGVRDLTVPSKDGYLVPIRVYIPNPDTFGPGPYGVHVNYHGGGFIFGGLESDAKFCMTVKQEVGIVVVDVNYRLCPEYEFGRNIEDAWAVLSWVSKYGSLLNVNSSSLSIGGVSAGAHFCCVLQHLARDSTPPINIRLAMCAVPPVDDHSAYATPAESPYPSFSEMANAPLLNWARISHFQKHISKSATVEPWMVSPLRADNFKNLCPTFVITAGCDPLRDEGEAYAKKLLEGGNKVTVRRYLGVPHPFIHVAELAKAKLYSEDVCSALRFAHAN